MNFRFKIFHKTWGLVRYLLLILPWFVCLDNGSIQLEEGSPYQPNIIIIMADDLGYGDLSSFGGDGTIHTPYIDRLVEGGLKMTDFHSNGVVCSPTRASLLTGLYPQEAGIASVVTARHHRHTGMSPNKYTLAEFLKESGYRTGMFGKWHLGYQPEYGPVVQGFDHFQGFVSGNIDYFSHIDQEGYPDWWQQKKLHPQEGYLTNLITDHGLEFMDHAQDKPFFLYLAHGAPHYPLQGPGDKAYRTAHGDFQVAGDRSNKFDTYRAMIEFLDSNIGRIITYLEDKALLENTLIMFFSDNGATKTVGSNHPFRGAKSSVYEGGHRVPAVFYWENVIEPGTSDALVLTMDIFPTIVDLIDSDLSDTSSMSGLSVVSLWMNPQLRSRKNQASRTVFWRWLANKQTGYQKAVRQNHWKLIINQEGTALYNLEKDPGEMRNVSRIHPDKAQELSQVLEEWEATIKDSEMTVKIKK